MTTGKRSFPGPFLVLLNFIFKSNYVTEFLVLFPSLTTSISFKTSMNIKNKGWAAFWWESWGMWVESVSTTFNMTLTDWNCHLAFAMKNSYAAVSNKHRWFIFILSSQEKHTHTYHVPAHVCKTLPTYKSCILSTQIKKPVITKCRCLPLEMSHSPYTNTFRSTSLFPCGAIFTLSMSDPFSFCFSSYNVWLLMKLKPTEIFFSGTGCTILINVASLVLYAFTSETV